MQKLSLGIFVVVALFSLSLVGVLIFRGRTVPKDPAELPPTRADYRIKEVHLQEKGSGNTLWKLDADLAEVYERDGKTLLRRVTITIEEADRTWTVTGDEGEFLDASKDVTIKKNVVLISSDGTRLETDSLRWRAQEKKVWTDAPVTLYRKGAVVRGQGLETQLPEERTAVKGRVRVTFARQSGGR
jgi:LPS export ABC transporter protein LptC